MGTVGGIDLIDALLAGGPVVVAGLGLRLVPALLDGEPPAPLAWTRRLHPVGAAAAVLSLLVGPGVLAGGLATVWLLVVVPAVVAGVLVALAARPAPGALVPVAVGAGLVYLGVGATWLVFSRFGWRPLDLSTDIVRLTGVHFHYAGFGLPVLAAAAATGIAGSSQPAGRVVRTSVVAGLVASVVGPPMVATGFTLESAAGQMGGAVAMTVAAWGVAVGTLAVAARIAGPAWARVALVVSGLSPWVAMVLAVHWAVGQHTSAVRSMPVDDMALTHGLLNGVGFVGIGLLGWLRVRGTPDEVAFLRPQVAA